jgi:hypothetical protein
VRSVPAPPWWSYGRALHLKAPRKPLSSGMGRNGSALTNMSVIITGVPGIL